MKLIDTHAHLDHLEDIEQALMRADDSGISGIIAVSEDLKSSKRNLEIAKQFTVPKIYSAIGMHPSEANLDDLQSCLDLARENASNIIAIGEIGLDFWYKWVRKDDQKKDEQRQVYRAFLELAKELDLPVSIHSRGAWQECFDILSDIGLDKAVFHWYSGKLEVLEKIIESGYYVSATPSLAFSPEAREAIEKAPADRILIETDTPVYYRNRQTNEGFKAEPKDTFKTLSLCCELKGIDLDEGANIFNKNVENLFNLTNI